jgi:hypothetical protein
VIINATAVDAPTIFLPCLQGPLGTSTPAKLVSAASQHCSGWSWWECLSTGKTYKR